MATRRTKKPLRDDPNLTQRIKEAIDRVKNMTPEEFKAMIDAQQKSWAKQDMD